MRILVVSPFLPYAAVPHAGGKYIRMVLEHLSKRYEVDLVTRVFPEEVVHAGEVSGIVGKLIQVRESASASPQGGGWLARAASYRRLSTEASKVAVGGGYDAALVEYTETGIFLDLKDWPPAILDTHDIIAKPWFRRWEQSYGIRSIVRWAVYRLLAEGERRAINKFGVAICRSSFDADYARKMYFHRDLRVIAIPAGIGFSAEGRSEVPGRLLFLGAMGRQLNVDAAMYFYRKVFPSVRARCPSAEFWIVGGNPPQSLRDLEANDPAIHVTGFVDDIGEHYRAASVFVAPILVGGGIIVKIIDAMAAGVPVVTTTYGNEGIGAEDGKDILIADDAETSVAKVLALLADIALRKRIGESGRAFARSRFSREEIMNSLEGALAEISGSKSPSG